MLNVVLRTKIVSRTTINVGEKTVYGIAGENYRRFASRTFYFITVVARVARVTPVIRRLERGNVTYIIDASLHTQ